MNTIEGIMLGYMITYKDFSTQVEMFDSTVIRQFIKSINKSSDELTDEEKCALKTLGEKAKAMYTGYLTEHHEMEEDDAIKAIKNEFDENYYNRIGFFDMVYDDLFDVRLRKKITDEYVKTGFENLDFYLEGGLKKRTFTGIQATTGGGKTTMLLSIGSNLLKRGYNVAFVNLEMNEQEFNNNILSGLMYGNDTGEFTHYRINNYNNIEDDEDFTTKLKEKVQSLNIGKHAMIVNNSYKKINSSQLENILQIEENRLGIKFDAVLIDYLFLLDTFTKGLKNEQSYENLQRLSQEAHKMSQRNNWAVLSVFQTNRGGFSADKGSAVDIAGSFNALHDMDNFFAFSREKGTNYIIVTPGKLRQYNGTRPIEDFKLKYSQDYKIYIEDNECERKAKDYNWRELWIIPELHQNLSVADFNELLSSLGKEQVTKGTISKFEKEKNITHAKKSLVNWKDLNLDNITRKYYFKDVNYGSSPLTNLKLGEMSKEDEMKSLFGL